MPPKTARPTETIEDYLQLIYTMQREGTPVIAARVKERKGVSAPTAWATLKRMERDGLVKLADGHRIDLTPTGLEKAQSIIRRHMLAERLLVDILHLDWADVHDEAHKVEHAISPVIEKQILALLENPQTCPHGNPIPGLAPEGPTGAFALRTVHEGDMVTINNIAEHAEEDADLMHYLQRTSLVPGVRLHIDEVALANATITVSLPDHDGSKVVVGLPTSELILVRPANN
ncbi:MAG TPA: metal-dependent transcriptional regulator [Dehalococcoidia bacterium]|nr:metal-dependent transcriptional regulator [Dehalococcoidia bacterium]